MRRSASWVRPCATWMRVLVGADGTLRNLEGHIAGWDPGGHLEVDLIKADRLRGQTGKEHPGSLTAYVHYRLSRYVRERLRGCRGACADRNIGSAHAHQII